MDMSLSKLLEIVKSREAWHAAVHGAIILTPQLGIKSTPEKQSLNHWNTKVVCIDGKDKYNRIKELICKD